MNFVSETTLQENRAKRAAEWADTYERINVKPPVLEEQPYDPRSLAEQLAANKAVKEAEFEERIKFSLSLPCPALRPLIFGGRKPVPVSEDARACGTVQPARSGIDDEEAGFLSDMAYDIRQQERMQKEEIANELASFREKQAAPRDPPPVLSTSTSTLPAKAEPSKPVTAPKPAAAASKPPPKKATQRGLLAGAIKRKKPDAPAKPAAAEASTSEDPAAKKPKTS